MSLTALVSYEVSRGSAKAVNMGRTKKEDIPVLILNLQPFFILQPVAFSLPLPNCRAPPKAVTAFSRYLMYACPVDSPSSSTSFGFDFDVAATVCLALFNPAWRRKHTTTVQLLLISLTPYYLFLLRSRCGCGGFQRGDP